MKQGNEIIKITKGENGQQLVSARELHEFLDVKSRFNDWIKNRIEKYDFQEENDYTKILVQCVRGQNEYDFAITIDMAKELSMVENNEKGKQARRYFIACEKQLKETDKKAQLLLDIYNGGQSAVIASKQLTEIEVNEATVPLLNTIEEQKPLVEFTNTVLKSKDNILMRELSKIAKDEGIQIGQNRLYDKLREWKLIMKKPSTEPYQRGMDSGWFVVEERSINTPYGIKLTKTTKVTPKGQVYIIEKLKSELQNN